MTTDELQRRLELFVRLYVAEHSEDFADEAIDRLALQVQQGGHAASSEYLCLQALGIARTLVWEAKLRLARGESMALETSTRAINDANRLPAREALRVAFQQVEAAHTSSAQLDATSMPTPAELRDLLLHRLSELDAQRIEEQLLLYGTVADGVRSEETDLLDDYSAERLRPDERQDVERFLLTSPAARQRVKVTRALRDIGQRRGSQSAGAGNAVAPWNRWSLRAAGAIVVCMLALSFYLTTLNDNDTLPAEPTPATSRADKPAPEAEPEVSASFNVLLLTAQQDGAYPLSLSGDAADVRLQAETPFADLSKTYQLVVQTPAGEAVFTASDLPAREAGGLIIVEAVIPARSFGAGMRTVVLMPAKSSAAVATWTLDVQRDQ